MKEVKKRSKKENFYLMVHDLISKGESPISICSKLNISKQRLQYYLNYLKENGFIRKLGYGTWEEVKTFSLGLEEDKPITNLHALQIRIPILKGTIRDKDWQTKNKLNNWLPKYKNFNVMGGIGFRNNNNKSLTIWVKSRDIKDLNEVDNLAFKLRAFTYDYFKKEDIILDIFNCETKNLNLATEDKEAKGLNRKGEKFELNLMKKAEKIFSKDNIDAKAWVDSSPKPFTAETNDKEWKREYLSMPFRIRDTIDVLNSMSHNLAYVAENYKSHVGIVEEAHKIFKKINSRLSQKKLKEWF